MEIIIIKEDCENAPYLDSKGCPLYKAIKRQYPNYPLGEVGGGYIIKTSGKTIGYHNGYHEGWNYTRMKEIQNGIITAFTVKINDYELTGDKD